MRLIGLAIAAVAVLWYARRRRREEPAAVPGAPAPLRTVPATGAGRPRAAESAPTSEPSTGGEKSERVGLDASAGWDDDTNEPTRRDVSRPDSTPPGMPGDDVRGVAAWDRLV